MAGTLGQKSRLYMQEYIKETRIEFKIDLKTTCEEKSARYVKRSFLS